MKYLLILLFSSTLIFSQNKEQKRIIISKYDVENSRLVTSYLKAQDSLRLLRIKNFILDTGQDASNIRDVLDDGTILKEKPDNLTSGITIRSNHLNTGGSLGLNLNGQGMQAGVWEAENGYPLLSHLDLENRITIIDGSNNINFHATHVVGTIISSGQNSAGNLGRGIAYEASVLAANSNSDLPEMSSEAAQGLLISNHSYGLVANNLPLWIFGAYNSDAFSLDLITSNFPYYLPVVSAGNDRNNSPSANPEKNGFDLLTGFSNSKNCITSAAVNQVINYSGPSSVQMSNFSNWGPTDDGRIKPDISSKGVSVLSTSNQSNTSYGTSQGTSMSAPAISGLLLLMQQHFNNLYGNFMLAATAKGLLLHTADEAGTFQGPDYRFGWGLANGLKAAQTISQNGSSSTITEQNLSNNSIDNYIVKAIGNQPLMVSLSWTDPEGSVVSNVIDDTTPKIVNDLDLSVESDVQIFYPWKLDLNNPLAGATRNSQNNVDVFEKVEVDNPNQDEIFTITISHKNSLQGDSQNYSLIVTGGVIENLSDESFSLNQIKIFPNPTSDFISVSGLTDEFEYDVFNIQGKVLSNGKIDSINNQIDLSSLSNGIYIIRVGNGDNFITKKIIKK